MDVYFPHRDKGFDLIASKETDAGHYLIRPVQVKGKYPTKGKGDKSVYGYVGRLSTLHAEMVLAIPFFARDGTEVPTCVAYLPRAIIRKHSRGFRCQPASFHDGSPAPRRDYAKFFDTSGLILLEIPSWKDSGI